MSVFCVNQCFFQGPKESLDELEMKIEMICQNQDSKEVQRMDEYFFAEEDSQRKQGRRQNFLSLSFITRTQPPFYVLSNWISLHKNTQCRLTFNTHLQNSGIWIAQTNDFGKQFEKSMNWTEPLDATENSDFKILTEEPVTRSVSSNSLEESISPEF